MHLLFFIPLAWAFSFTFCLGDSMHLLSSPSSLFLSPSLLYNLLITILSSSFKSKKSSSHSRERGRGRNASRSPPPPTPTLPSCLRASASSSSTWIPLGDTPIPTPTSASTATSFFFGPGTNTDGDTSPSIPTMRSLPTLCAIYTSASVVSVSAASTSASTSASPSTSSSPPLTSNSKFGAAAAAAAHTHTERTVVPLRACCPECAANAKMDVAEEAFSRGALRVRRRAAAFGPGPASLVGMGESSLVEAARRGGFLEAEYSPTSPYSTSAYAAAHAGSGSGSGGEEEEGNKLMSGTGLTEVNRLVAELERRRSASATPVGTPPLSPVYSTGGRASPSLLGPALARLAGGEGGVGGVGHAYGDRLTPGSTHGSAHGSRHGTPPYAGSGRASPLLPLVPVLPLGIAVDEVDKERRRRSVGAGGGPGSLRGV
ncbi:hypothetical protein B0H19DRAFT_690534 [Mycena capillaripes]|nr:hypothetical protein B0H19DRAFT_690534 [Mycena capillaripes]